MDAKKKRNNKNKKNKHTITNHTPQISNNTQQAQPQAQAQQEEEPLDASAATHPTQNGLPLSDPNHKPSQMQHPLPNGLSLLQQQDNQTQPPHKPDSAVPRVAHPQPHHPITDQYTCQQNLLNLQEAVQKLEAGMNSPLQKVTILEDRLSKMQDKVDSYVQNEFSLEDKISKMQNKVDMHSQNELYLGRKLHILQNESDILAKKQVSLEDKFKRIEDMKCSWSLKEGSLNATITCLEEANRTLQMRVKALERSTYNTDQENRKVIETLSLVDLRIEALEAKSIEGSLSAEVTKMMEEQSDVIITQPADKQINQHISHFMDPLKLVNELDIKQKETIKDLPKSDLIRERCLNVSPPLVETIQENSETMLPTVQAMQYPSTVPVGTNSSDDTTITVDIDQVQKLELHLPSLSEETVHPLQDVEINEDEVASNDERTGAVPLTDAPLIGAPFRLFSFMAKYVAGSDLVNETSSKSGN